VRPLLVLATVVLALSSCRVMDTRHGQVKPPPGLEGPDAPPKKWRVGAEISKYPVGWQGGVIATYPLMEDDDFVFRLGYNYADRGDNGVHDNEDGGGPGVGVGAYHYFSPRDENSWLIGSRVDFWWLSIDWEDDARATTPAVKGTTDTFTIQPMVEGGYIWRNRILDLVLMLGLGWEWNAHVPNGQANVGQGPIMMVTLRTVL